MNAMTPHSQHPKDIRGSTIDDADVDRNWNNAGGDTACFACVMQLSWPQRIFVHFIRENVSCDYLDFKELLSHSPVGKLIIHDGASENASSSPWSSSDLRGLWIFFVPYSLQLEQVSSFLGYQHECFEILLRYNSCVLISCHDLNSLMFHQDISPFRAAIIIMTVYKLRTA
jgi:hypothetical protein